MKAIGVLLFGLVITGVGARADDAFGPADCGQMESWDYATAMCRPVPMAGMPMAMYMVHGNGFLVQSWESGPRGDNALGSPNMLMLDAGKSLGGRHYLNLEWMATGELWTLPPQGYPELLQVGEDHSDGAPFLDHQHPHSTPVMGLTLSDTISFGADEHYGKIWFAPRGASTDGPVPFMHRITGMVNPDAPLGHHVGQDVGHISGTVIGASARLGEWTVEASAFHGAEPQPTKVDLPIGSPDSVAARLTYVFSEHLYGMGSFAYVKNPEPGVDHVHRISASAYADADLGRGWILHDALIWGFITNLDQAASLGSFAEEAMARKQASTVWARLEVLQRTPAELAVTGAGNLNGGRWVTAATFGYTHRLLRWNDLDLGLGGSVALDFLPDVFRSTYGGNPRTGRIFLQAGGMTMGDF